MMLAPSDFVANSDDMIMALVLGGIVLMTPVIAIVTYHQRKMADRPQGQERRWASNRDSRTCEVAARGQVAPGADERQHDRSGRCPIARGTRVKGATSFDRREDDAMIANLDAGAIAVLVPIVSILVVGAFAVAKMLTSHQRQMVELMQRQSNEPGLVDEIRAMRREMAELRDRVNQQTLMIESAERPRSTPPDVPQRLSE